MRASNSLRCSAFLIVALMLLSTAIAKAQTPSSDACATPKSVRSTHTTPPWPHDTYTLSEEGTTDLAVAIGRDGTASEVTVAKTSGSKGLDDAAVSWVKANYRWEPREASCGAAAVTTAVRIVWHNTNIVAPQVPAEGAIPTSWSAQAEARQKANAFNIPCNVNDIKATLRLTSPQRSANSTPLLGISLRNPQGDVHIDGPEVMVLRLAALANAKTPDFFLRKDGGHTHTDEARFPNKIDFGQDIPIELAWTTERQISVTVDWKKTSVAMDAVPTILTLFVSGGQGEISNIQASWQGSAKSQSASCQKAP